MSLKIQRLKVRGFRSYDCYELEPAQGLTVIVGPNAVGKTNLIEAIQLLTAGESFRKPQWGELVRWGSENTRISLDASGDDRSVSIEMAVVGGRREYSVNGKTKRRIIDVVGVLPSVVFVPDDLKMTKDSAERRRSILDTLGSQLSPAYLTLKSEYERVLRQRNKILKKEAVSEKEIDAWTERLIVLGSRFEEARDRLFGRVRPAMIEAHRSIAVGPPLEAFYLPSWKRDGVEDQGTAEASMREHLRQKAGEEKARATSLVGPHRDDVEFRLANKEARAYASQGQHRAIALSWKLAEVAVINEVSGQAPVLLLDDVMSELDEERRHALATRAGLTTQTIVTTTDTGHFEPELLARAKIVDLR